jgi:hypothetical protein
MISGTNKYWLKSMDKEETYYFRIESINENGISRQSDIFKAE